MPAPEKAALLLMDFQEEIVAAVEAGGSRDAVAAAARALAAARKAGMPVVYVRVEFRPGHPEASANNKRGAAIKSANRLVAGTDGARIVAELAPRDDEPVVSKRRVGALGGTDLGPVLRGLRVDTLYMAGLATSGVVLSTSRHASDQDYRMVVLSDACADFDAEVHAVLMNKVLPMQCDILSVADFETQLG